MAITQSHAMLSELSHRLDSLPLRRNNPPIIIFITGASGAGKTYLVDEMEKKFSHEKLGYFRFDKIGVPPVENRISEYGSGENWQRAMTHEWVRRFVHERPRINAVIFEGQYNLDFVEEACSKYGIIDFCFVVLTVPDDVMADRLIHLRKQPELVNNDMRNWSRFLKKQGESKGALVLDTSAQNIDELIDALMGQMLDLLGDVV